MVRNNLHWGGPNLVHSNPGWVSQTSQILEEAEFFGELSRFWGGGFSASPLSVPPKCVVFSGPLVHTDEAAIRGGGARPGRVPKTQMCLFISGNSPGRERIPRERSE